MAVHGGVLGKDHYEVLGLAEEASPEDIQRAYRRLARRHHPDANPGDAGAEERFEEISGAHEVLSDPAKRRQYDQVGRSGYAADGFDPGAGTFRVAVDDLGDLGGFGDLDDLLGDLFGGCRPASARQSRDLEARLDLSFEDAVFGVTTEVQARKVPTLDDEPLTVRVPPGTPTGRTLRVRGRGVPRLGGDRGDLLVTIEVAVPQRLTSQQRTAVEALAQAMDGSPRTHLEV